MEQSERRESINTHVASTLEGASLARTRDGTQLQKDHKSSWTGTWKVRQEGSLSLSWGEEELGSKQGLAQPTEAAILKFCLSRGRWHGWRVEGATHQIRPLESRQVPPILTGKMELFNWPAQLLDTLRSRGHLGRSWQL